MLVLVVAGCSIATYLVDGNDRVLHALQVRYFLQMLTLLLLLLIAKNQKRGGRIAMRASKEEQLVLEDIVHTKYETTNTYTNSETVRGIIEPSCVLI